MNNGIEKIEKIIDEIEAKLTSEIDYEAIASKMALSVYEFRRVFAFIVGCPVSEYVRRRRLSLAACELISDKKISIRELSEKYGYSTLSAFSKAFSEYHGFSPTVCQKEARDITVFPRQKFEWSIRHSQEQSFQILNDGAFAIKGYSALSDHTDTCCCEQVWSDFYELGTDRSITGDKLFVSYRNGQGKVRCCIGERVDKSDNADDTIQECRWLCVKMNTTDDDVVNRKYNDILCDLLPSANFKRQTDMPTVEVFPLDMSEDNFEWEIRIPIV